MIADPHSLTLTAEELGGDVPLVCVRTGRPATRLVGVWFARSALWTWIPLGLVIAAAVGTGRSGILTSYWGVGSIAVPVIFSRGTTGALPLSPDLKARLSHLRGRRLRVLLSALLLTWVAVGLWLVGSHVAGVVVLVGVITLYLGAIAMVVYGRRMGVRGRPTGEGGALVHNAHPDFIDALELYRTGHRP